MLFGHMTDVLPHAFLNAAHALSHSAFEVGQDIWTALREEGALSPGDKALQIAKIAGTTAILGISVVNFNIEGIAGCCIAESEAFVELEKAGHKWRAEHAPSL
jgi:hypothetical protein